MARRRKTSKKRAVSRRRRPATKPKPKSRASRKRSAAARRGWETRRHRVHQEAVRRRQAGHKAAQTRKRNQARKRARKTAKSGYYKQKYGGFFRWYYDQPLTAAYGELDADQVTELLLTLMERARDEFYPLAKRPTSSAGVRVRISTEDDEDGEPIWERDKGRFTEETWQTPFTEEGPYAFQVAQDRAREMVHALVNGGRWSHRIRHAYRLWIVGLIAYVLDREKPR